MIEKFFTPREADQCLPLVKAIVEAILEKAKHLRSLMATQELPGSHEAEILRLDQEIKALMMQLEALGCLYKDWNFEIGLVDFPAIIHGQEALLCWRSDERAIGFFHGYEDGYAGRRPITKDLIFS